MQRLKMLNVTITNVFMLFNITDKLSMLLYCSHWWGLVTRASQNHEQMFVAPQILLKLKCQSFSNVGLKHNMQSNHKIIFASFIKTTLGGYMHMILHLSVW